MKTNDPKVDTQTHKAFFSAIAVESIIIFIILAFQASAPEGRFFLLYSAPRLLELAFFVIVGVGAAWGIKNLKQSAWGDNFQKLFSSSPWKERLIFGGISVLALSQLIIITLKAYSDIIDLHFLLGYATHLRPIIFYFSLLGFEITLWALLINRENLLIDLRKKSLRLVIIIWILFNIIIIFGTFFDGWELFLLWILITIMAIFFGTSRRNAIKKTDSYKKQIAFIAILIAIFSFVFQINLQSMARPHAKDNFYFQEWSSEKMMNVVSLKDLQNSPLETLNNIHTTPPGTDIIRAIFLHIWRAPDIATSLLHVDFLLYQLWAVLYSLLAALLFLWLTQLTNIKVAIIATLALLIHPAFLLYATLLENSFLTSFLIFLLIYLLWRIKNGSKVSIALLISLSLTLFFIRSIFQLPFFIVMSISLFLLKAQKEKILIFLLITLSVISIYGIKQYKKFGSFSTSSFTGLNLNRSVSNPNYIDYWNIDIDYQEPDKPLPRVLTRIKKVDGSPNYNHVQYLEYNEELIKQYKKYIFTSHPSQLLKSYWENLTIYFRPSSEYNTKHEIVDRLPWRNFYDSIFSFPILVFLLLFLGIRWLIKNIKNKDYWASIGLMLPGLYIFLVTVLFEKGENMRFKFFLEPLFFIFIVSQAYDFWIQLQAKRVKFSK